MILTVLKRCINSFLYCDIKKPSIEHPMRLVHIQYGKGAQLNLCSQSWCEVQNPVSIPMVSQDGLEYNTVSLHSLVTFRRDACKLASTEPCYTPAPSWVRSNRFPGLGLQHRPWSTPALQQRGGLREAHGTTTAMHHRVHLLPGTASL